MIETIALVILIVALANKPRRRRRFNLKGVRTRATLSLGTLGSFALVVGSLLGVSDNEYRLVSVKLNWNLETLTAGDGPILVGLAHGDYTAAEIEACIEASGSINKADKVAEEVANRLVRIVGVLHAPDSSLNDGRPMKTKLNWAIPEGVALDFWAYNENTSALNTGASVNVAGMTWIRYT